MSLSKSYHHLTHDQRCEISALKRKGHSMREIAATVGVHHSTVSRELGRNASSTKNGYHAKQASEQTASRRLKANQRFTKIAGVNSSQAKKLTRYIVKKLHCSWSPEQIAGVLKARAVEFRVTHQVIYDWIYLYRPDLKKLLRCKKGKYRRTREARLRKQKRNQLKQSRSIDSRPKHVLKRRTYGHWEGDTIVGIGHKSMVATHVERKSGYLLAKKLDKPNAESFRAATNQCFSRINPNYLKTLTLDNGTENAQFEAIERDNDLHIYFAHPYHSWERGTNENTNGLLREYFPKGTDFNQVSQKEIDQAVHLINTRPRKRLNYKTPEAVLRACGAV